MKVKYDDLLILREVEGLPFFKRAFNCDIVGDLRREVTQKTPMISCLHLVLQI